MNITWPDRAAKLTDHELLLWLLISGLGRWDGSENRLYFSSFYTSCQVDTLGLPTLDDETRALLRDLHAISTEPFLAPPLGDEPWFLEQRKAWNALMAEGFVFRSPDVPSEDSVGLIMSRGGSEITLRTPRSDSLQKIHTTLLRLAEAVARGAPIVATPE